MGRAHYMWVVSFRDMMASFTVKHDIMPWLKSVGFIQEHSLVSIVRFEFRATGPQPQTVIDVKTLNGK